MTAETSNARGEWVLVPREPTQAMLEAFNDSRPTEGNNYAGAQSVSAQERWEFRQRYAAMLASAPPSATVGVEDGPIDASENAEYIEHCADRLERCGLRVTAGALRVIAHEHRALAQQPADAEVREAAPLRYFAYDSDNGDYNEYATLAEAVASAQESLDYAGDDGWPDGGPTVVYGAVLGEAREVAGSRRPTGPGDPPDFDFIVEYELTPAPCALTTQHQEPTT